MWYPLTFTPVFKERIWGGRTLETLYHKPLPSDVPIGESWEISDRQGDESVVANGPLAGTSLHALMRQHASDLLGGTPPTADGRFPALCKILDARERLSLQVHPPASLAAALGGEPKTEMWYIADAGPDAELFVGLKPGVTRAEFEARIASGEVADCFHRIPVRAGDAMFLPSGRVHAIGAGLVIFEIQQNSDTTYRVYDWDRRGPDGQLRELHIPQSLASIDFDDVAPSLVQPEPREDGGAPRERLVFDPVFIIDLMRTGASRCTTDLPAGAHIIATVTGAAEVAGNDVRLPLAAGQFGLIPAALRDVHLSLASGTSVLLVSWPR